MYSQQPHSWDFFTILRVEADWLTWPLDKWGESEDFRKARQFVTTVKVVNDAATTSNPSPRTVLLGEKFSKLLNFTGERRRTRRRAPPTNEFMIYIMIF